MFCLLRDGDGEVMSLNGDDLVIRAGDNPNETEVVYDGQVMAILQNTDTAALSTDRMWLGNPIFLEGIAVPAPEPVIIPVMPAPAPAPAAT